MIEEIRNRLDFQYETNSSMKYLVVITSSDEAVNKNHMEMIGKNSIQGILPMNVVYKDDKVNVFYNITSKIPLLEYLKSRKLKSSQLIDLLKGVCNTILDAEYYFMKDKYFLFDENYIFVEPDDNKLCLVFLPFIFEAGGQDAFKDFVKSLITDLVVLENGENTSIFGLIPYIREKSFNIKDFSKRLNELDISKATPLMVKPIDTSQEQYINASQSPQVSDIKQSQKKAIPSCEVPKAKNQIKNSQQNYTTEKQTKMKYKGSSIIIFVILQLVLIGIFAIGFSPAQRMSGDAISTVAAFVIAFGGIDLFLFRRFFDKKNMISVEVEVRKPVSQGTHINEVGKVQQPVGQNNVTHPKKVNMHVADVSGEVRKGKVVIPKFQVSQSVTYEGNQPKTDIKSETKDPVIDKTEVLSDDNTVLLNVIPYLKPSDDSSLVYINKSSFVIGRQEEQVDFVSKNTAVGRIHAKIIAKDAEYYLIDLNSTNGTFLNALRLQSNNEYKLSANDTVSFANSKYVFIIPEPEV